MSQIGFKDCGLIKCKLMILTSPKLFVRYLCEDDFDAFSALVPITSVKFKSFVSVPSKTCLAVCEVADQSFIGRCGFRETNERIELEIFLIPTKQNHGFGHELLSAMILYARTEFPRLTVAATVSPSNSRMIHLLTGHGFRNSGETIHMKAGLQDLYTIS